MTASKVELQFAARLAYHDSMCRDDCARLYSGYTEPLLNLMGSRTVCYGEASLFTTRSLQVSNIYTVAAGGSNFPIQTSHALATTTLFISVGTSGAPRAWNRPPRHGAE